MVEVEAPEMFYRRSGCGGGIFEAMCRIIYLWSFKSLLVLCSVSCPAIRRKKLDDSEDARFLLDEMTPEHLLETETTGISCQNQSSHSG